MQRRDVKFAFLLVLFVFHFVSCAGLGLQKKWAYPGNVTAQMQTEFEQTEEQYRRRAYDHAYAGYDRFIQSYEYNPFTDEAWYKQGKIFFLTQRYEDAADKFRFLAERTPDPVYAAKGWHMSGYSLFRAKKFGPALEIFKKIKADALPAKMRMQFYSLVIESARHGDVQRDFADFAALRLFDLYEEYAGQNFKNLHAPDLIHFSDVILLVEAWVDKPMSSGDISHWLKNYPETLAHAYVDYKLAKIYYEEKNYKKARSLFSKFVRRYPKNPYTVSAQKILAELGGPVEMAGTKLTQYRVGVLLPLTGKYESYSRAVLDGVRCAIGDDGACGDKSGVTLIVRETGFTQESLERAVEEMEVEGVVAIVGPLSGDMALQAGITASAKKIPIFPITQKADIMSQGDYIFQVGLQPKQMIRALAQEARSRGLRDFGIFYPDNEYGRVMAELFADEVKSRGGYITAQAAYNRQSIDPYAEARKLKQSVGRVGHIGSGVGFDAVFIPDSYQVVNTMIGALEFNGITGVPLLGTNAWNDPGLSLSMARKFPGSFFVDLYDGSAGGNLVKDFKQRFSASFGRSPRVLEAYGYDIMNIIRQIAEGEGGGKIKHALENNRGFSGVTGLRGFRVGDSPVAECAVLNVGEEGLGSE